MMNYDQSKKYAPTDMINGFAVRPGLYLSNGASVVDGGVNFTIHSWMQYQDSSLRSEWHTINICHTEQSEISQ